MTTLVPISSEPLGFGGGEDEVTPIFFDWRQTLLSQYANSPVIVAILDALGLAIDRAAVFEAFYDTVRNVDTAIGFGLDIWGRIVGVSRALYVDNSDPIAAPEYLGFSDASDAHSFGEGVFWGLSVSSGPTVFTPNFLLTDNAYRKLILAKAALNITNSSIPAINAILRALFPAYGNVYVRDNSNMTMTFVFGATLSKVDYAIVTQSGVLPRPIGVTVGVEQP